MLINSPNISGSLKVTGNTVITGSLTVLGGINATITGSATTASYVEYSNVANKPTLVSGSAQVSFNGITDKPTLVSGSSQVTYGGLSGIPSGIVSSSTQITGYNIFATTGSNQFNGSQAVTGSLTVTGQVVAQTLNVQQVTSSIVFSSGSNIFGNSLSNTQQFTGSVNVTGSLAVAGAGSFSGTGYFGGATVSSGLTGASELIVQNELGIQNGDTTGPYLRMVMGSVNQNITLVAGAFTGTEPNLLFSIGGATRLTMTPSGSSTFNLGSGEMRLNRTGTSEYLKLNTYYLLTDGNDQLLGSITGATSIYAGSGVSPKMTITSGGNVGIGVTSPGAKLTIVDLAITTTTALFVETAAQTTGHTAYFYSNSSQSGNTLRVYQDGAGSTGPALYVYSDGAYGAVFEKGNVGIGTASPAWPLDIQSTSGALGISLRGRSSDDISLFTFFNNAANTQLAKFTAASTYLGVDVGGTERMRITSGGNVGIGTNDPQAKLEIKSGYLRMFDPSSGLNAGYAIEWSSNNGGTNVSYANIDAITTSAGNRTGDLLFRTSNAGSPSERMRITSAGRVGIGVTNPDAGLQIAQPGQDDQLTIGSIANNRDHAAFMCSGANKAEILRYQSATRLVIGSSGNISNLDVVPGGTNGVRLSAGNTSWSAYTSDERKKKNFETVPGLEALLQVNPVKYHFKTQDDSEVKKLGFTAQNIQPLIPEMVHPNGEKAEDGSDILTIIPDYILPVLVKAIQEQQSQIETLKSKIEILEQS
jgi:hypothetical protein